MRDTQTHTDTYPYWPGHGSTMGYQLLQEPDCLWGSLLLIFLSWFFLNELCFQLLYLTIIVIVGLKCCQFYCDVFILECFALPVVKQWDSLGGKAVVEIKQIIIHNICFWDMVVCHSDSPLGRICFTYSFWSGRSITFFVEGLIFLNWCIFVETKKRTMEIDTTCVYNWKGVDSSELERCLFSFKYEKVRRSHLPKGIIQKK